MEKNISLSLCMIVKDEEATLERCLNSVKSFIDEIIIVDTGSTDSTREIAKKFNAKIYDFKWIDDFAAARNFAFSKSTSEYTMWLDADDFISEDSIKEIENLLVNFDKQYDYVSAEYILLRYPNGKVSYSLKRNRIVRTSMNFKWIGNVHEYLEVYGNGLAGNFAIEHGKVKQHTDRNLQIFKAMEKNKKKFTPRDLLYYANELKDNAYYDEAVKNYRKFLATKLGWIEDIKTAYAKIIDCFKATNKKDQIPNVAFESFKYDVPRADICCSLAEYFMEKNEMPKAAFWYRTALDCIPPKDSMAIDNKEFYTFIPAIQLCVCYDRMGNLNCAYFFNELAGAFIGSSDKVDYNRQYFKNRFSQLNIEAPSIEYPIKISDYTKYL